MMPIPMELRSQCRNIPTLLYLCHTTPPPTEKNPGFASAFLGAACFFLLLLFFPHIRKPFVPVSHAGGVVVVGRRCGVTVRSGAIF